MSVREDIRAPTSTILGELIAAAPGTHVTLAWLIENLHERSFGILMFLMALIALVPGASGIVGILLMIPAIQMILAQPVPVLPRFVGKRPISVAKLARLIRRIDPTLRWLERIIRPRWRTPFMATQRVVGGFMLLLGFALLAPIPFSQIPAAIVVMLVAFAYLEEDGLVLCLALLAALATLGAMGVAGWALVEGFNWLERM
ncbi:MAG: exopolysaccharide biosynthesis protein [Alphaproteobacteria bacterium]